MKKGFSLVELLVAVGIVAILVGFSIPAINALQKSYNSTGADSMISAALATARTLAISNHQYAGVRFQMAGDPNNALKADQYMIFIINDEGMSTLGDEYRVVEGYKPMKLPANIGVMDMRLGVGNSGITSDNQIDEIKELVDTSAFSIIFSPAGKLVIHDVQTRNKDGKDYNDSPGSDDIVFNIKSKVNSGIAMFIQDDDEAHTPDGLDKEKSRSSFVIYDRQQLDKLKTSERYSKYLINLKSIFVNPYTGQLIEK